MPLFDDDASPYGDVSGDAMFATADFSPAVPTMYSFESNDSSLHMGTVSPQDLFRDPPMSAPNSAAFTNLTTPSMYTESPALDYDNSPLIFNNVDAIENSSDPWFSLFPESNNVDPEGIDMSPLQPGEEKLVAEALREVNSSRRRSGTSSPGRQSSVSGVSRKRTKVLDPIIPDPGDDKAVKRARNTMAARKSREKKMQRFDELERQIAELKEERDKWKAIALRKETGHIGLP
jgi:general control protein GCN4